MAGNTEAEAVQNFIEPIRRALACVTAAPLQILAGFFARDEPWPLTVGRGEPLALDCDPPLQLVVNMQYRILRAELPLGPWKVSIDRYTYELEHSDGGRILAYHWHPTDDDPRGPHLHLARDARSGPVSLSNAHLPCGRVALEEVLRFLITELGVEPQGDKARALAVLDETQAVYEKYRTWGGTGPPR